MMRSLILLVPLFALLPIAASDANAADPITGPASVIDGDTIEVHGQRISLFAIDAPEAAQTCAVAGKEVPCGEQAAQALAAHIGQQTVTCKPKATDQQGDMLAICSAGGDDLNGWMVSQGMALAFRQSANKYVRREKKAAKAKLGLWRGYFVLPWDWRRGKRLTRERVFEEGVCPIKGNITRGGKRVYHVPGGQLYNTARIDTALGERWFCTEEEARKAGWKKSR